MKLLLSSLSITALSLGLGIFSAQAMDTPDLQEKASTPKLTQKQVEQVEGFVKKCKKYGSHLNNRMLVPVWDANFEILGQSAKNITVELFGVANIEEISTPWKISNSINGKFISTKEVTPYGHHYVNSFPCGWYFIQPEYGYIEGKPYFNHLVEIRPMEAPKRAVGDTPLPERGIPISLN